ncbi:hypothetical protein NEPAR06_2295 [Nematocida parisii]|uniref:Uncharacterized protein n=1 Tax=Nematocida parisii (strain ERTm3) TaxID=935791 RepID=I3EHR4_NEMP3|nr:uncharacterized protein NEPG_02363 [Nematocida parisii ERTm1]EIJ88761.1 hypothetical protein NEQG_00580 [Nematocida parisii ERTm3]KAI5131424.1 hypothetical protein NEPAR03_2431 [Nematocida parisii]EIJ92672.1 hypothetical protein NEPG_02363 [Nematocida parisii ERTm1]KAI5131428.1 hypothetical protein NEPAR08_2450 [Nematocida parisii]KAI5142997.1 hypothetical protein NEPAR07_0413 [Nematocida parisii]|eukprot:XP_013060190.1 hypothetical protein NEPG_02363 [Nematocida parisii ERTm1]
MYSSQKMSNILTKDISMRVSYTNFGCYMHTQIKIKIIQSHMRIHDNTYTSKVTCYVISYNLLYMPLYIGVLYIISSVLTKRNNITIFYAMLFIPLHASNNNIIRKFTLKILLYVS